MNGVNLANKGYVVKKFQAAKDQLNEKKDDISVSINEKKAYSPKILVTHVSKEEPCEELIENILSRMTD